MDDSEPLGPGNESYLASIVADGTATKEDAKRLIVEFVRQAGCGQVSPLLIGHLRDCFAAYLAGKKKILPSLEAGRDSVVSVPIKTLEKAFGLTRNSSGQPPIDSDTQIAAAAQLLEQRLAGVSHQEALTNVAEERRQSGQRLSSETEIGAAWAKYRIDALLWLKIGRVYRDEGWSADEITRLAEIYAGVPGAVLPGENMYKGRHAIPGQEHSQPVGSPLPDNAPEFPEDKSA